MIKILIVKGSKSYGFTKFGKMEEMRSLSEMNEKRSSIKKKD